MRLTTRLMFAGIAAIVLAAAAIAFTNLGSPSSAQTAKPGGAGRPVVVELFTSQSCSSCPPAEALFREYAGRADLITLEWHVDYWDSLVTGAGRWKDPYSSPKWTTRQRDYNHRIRGVPNVYTPQAVIGGASETTGFDRAAIDRFVAEASRKQPAARIAAVRSGSGLSFTIDGAPAGAEVLLVTFRSEAATRVKGGENDGRALSSAHLVTGVRKLDLQAMTSVPAPAKGDGCAVLVQGKDQGPVLAAAYCPA